MAKDALFRSKAPWIMALLMRDFALTVDDAAAVLGNLGHECAGFTLMQEQKPTVPGSAGGYGWAQWTGPRRKRFMAYCKRNQLDPASDKANYKYLFVELRGSEKAAIAALKAAKTLAAKVKAFELNFERAGKKHYPSRNAWAARALESYAAAGDITLPAWAEKKPAEEVSPPPAPEHAPEPSPRPAPAPGAAAPKEKKLRWSKRMWNGLVALVTGGSIGAGGLDILDVDRSFFVVAGGVVVAGALITILLMPEVRRKASRAIAALIP